jgi:3-polyprenyl-4-hydroxybenzoate decarboxylase
LYRLQIHSPSQTGIHWQIGKGGGFHFAVAEERNQSLPVTVFLGGPPALTLAAAAPLPEDIPEILLASLALGKRLPMCPGPGQHRLIAEAEFALNGHVPAGVRAPEGPFGDHYGYYSLQHGYPVFEVESIFHRPGAVFPATVVGKPRQEDFYIGDFLQEMLSPLFPLVMPGVEQIWAYGETGYHSLAAATVKERYKREAMASAFRILGEGQLSLTKFLLLTDKKIDLRDFKSTLQYVLQRTNPETDLFVLSNLSMDTLDYAGPKINEGSKGVWLGIGDPIRELPSTFESAELPQGISRVEVFCPGCLVVEGPRFADEPEAASRIASHPAFTDWPFMVLVDDARYAADNPVSFLWTTFTRFEPAADIHCRSKTVQRNHLSFSPPIVIDSRMKPSYPDELFCDPKTAKLVSRRWKEYFPEGMEMGDSDLGHLFKP